MGLWGHASQRAGQRLGKKVEYGSDAPAGADLAVDRQPHRNGVDPLKAAWYEPVRSNTLSLIQLPSAMPSMVHMITVPTIAPALAWLKYSRTMIA